MSATMNDMGQNRIGIGDRYEHFLTLTLINIENEPKLIKYYGGGGRVQCSALVKGSKRHRKSNFLSEF